MFDVFDKVEAVLLNDQSVQSLKLLKTEAFEPSGESGEQNPGGS